MVDAHADSSEPMTYTLRLYRSGTSCELADTMRFPADCDVVIQLVGAGIAPDVWVAHMDSSAEDFIIFDLLEFIPPPSELFSRAKTVGELRKLLITHYTLTGGRQYEIS